MDNRTVDEIFALANHNDPFIKSLGESHLEYQSGLNQGRCKCVIIEGWKEFMMESFIRGEDFNWYCKTHNTSVKNEPVNMTQVNQESQYIYCTKHKEFMLTPNKKCLRCKRNHTPLEPTIQRWVDWLNGSKTERFKFYNDSKNEANIGAAPFRMSVGNAATNSNTFASFNNEQGLQEFMRQFSSIIQK